MVWVDITCIKLWAFFHFISTRKTFSVSNSHSITMNDTHYVCQFPMSQIIRQSSGFFSLLAHTLCSQHRRKSAHHFFVRFIWILFLLQTKMSIKITFMNDIWFFFCDSTTLMHIRVKVAPVHRILNLKFYRWLPVTSTLSTTTAGCTRRFNKPIWCCNGIEITMWTV